MDETELGNGRTIRSVKAAIDMYGGGKIKQGTNVDRKFQNDAAFSKEQSSKAQELEIAENRISKIKENIRIAESEKSQAEYELLKAKRLVRELTSQIEATKSRTREFRKENKVEDEQYEEISREFEAVKQELSKIKLEIDRTVEEKTRAEKEAEAAGLKLEEYTDTAERLRLEIEEANDEELLVELAEIQARKELKEIESQKNEEMEEKLLLIEETRKKICVLKDEIEKMKDLEEKFELTKLDSEVLQHELNLIKEVDSGLRRKENLRSLAREVDAARKEYEAITAQGFQVMRSMDVIRNELNDVLKEKGEIERREVETEKCIKKLNSKILIAKEKLKAAKACEEKTKAMEPTLSLALEELTRAKEDTKKEESELRNEIENIRVEIDEYDTKNSTNEEAIEVVIEELEVVKRAELDVLGRLKTLAEEVARSRASKRKSTIRISKFEYDYLKGCAVEALELSDKKVAAANAWREALMAEAKEEEMKTARAEKEVRELKLKTEDTEHGAEMANEEVQNRRHKGGKSPQHGRSMKERDYSSTPGRETKFRRSLGSPATTTRRMSTSNSLIMRRRRKVMLNIAKYCANEHNEVAIKSP
ncbi:unnamed protein product [Amaranthus hypochondriacus]